MEKTSRPDILVILCDQLSARATKLYDPGFAESPNIDALLDRSLAFSRAYTVCPLCMPARAAIWTGRYPHETQVVANVEPPPEAQAPAFPALGETFAAAGYQTVHFGKKHDAGTLRGFEIAPDSVKRKFESDLPVNYDSFEDVDATASMVEFLKKGAARDRPFLAVADLNNPHNICQFVGENEKLPLPELAKLPELPANFRCGDWETRPLPVRYLCCAYPRMRQAHGWTPERYRFYLYAYSRYIAMVDRQIGEILTSLRESGRADNTIVVLLADHGEGMASFGLVTKQAGFYQPSLNIPLAIYDPRRPERKGIDRERVATNLDLYPTLCDAAGITPPAGLRGSSLLRGAGPGYMVSEWVSEYFQLVSPGRAWVDDHYKYVHFREGDGEELYDLAADPGETVNLAAKPEFRPLLETYRAKLKKHLEETGDDYFALPVIVDSKYRAHPSGFEHHTGSDAISEGRELYPDRADANLSQYTRQSLAARKARSK